MKKYLALFLLLASAAGFIACGDAPKPSSSTNSVGAIQNPNDTPTDAYKRLFAAVKSKNTEAIKAEFSKGSVAQAESEAARAKVPIAKVYENGFTATTYAESLPEIRDQRVNGIMGAIEVWNNKDDRWEDLPFIREQSGWKLAVGEAFSGAWKRPGIGQSMREMNAANAAGNRMINAMPNTNVNASMNRAIANMKANANANK